MGEKQGTTQERERRAYLLREERRENRALKEVEAIESAVHGLKATLKEQVADRQKEQERDAHHPAQ